MNDFTQNNPSVIHDVRRRGRPIQMIRKKKHDPMVKPTRFPPMNLQPHRVKSNRPSDRIRPVTYADTN